MNIGDQTSMAERISNKPNVYDKMENLIREMKDSDNGIPVRSQKMFLTSIPSAFMGYDLIEWLMERLLIEESEALNLANLFCSYGYFFPVNDLKNLTVKDDSSLYRFQLPCCWPGKVKYPDNIEYAIYLSKKSLRNKQRHGGLEDYELEALNNLKRNLQNKLQFITTQAEDQLKTEKDRKKGDKTITESQERAFWRIYRPPPGFLNILDQFPKPNRSEHTVLSIEEIKRNIDLLRNNLVKVRIKVSQAIESFILYVETYTEYDPFISGTQPSNPWVSDDITYWQLNSPLAEVATEKRVKRWSLSMEELVSDPTGLREFTSYLRKEYSHENIRFWLTVSSFRHSPQSQVSRKVQQIYHEFLAPGAPCEINIDGKTMEVVNQEMQNPSRFTFDVAAKHVYDLLLKKDCYPRFIRSEHYKNLLQIGTQNAQKKRFFVFGPTKKKFVANTHQLSFQNPNIAQHHTDFNKSQPVAIHQSSSQTESLKPLSNVTRRRGSDRSLTGSAHSIPVSKIFDNSESIVPHSQSQLNLTNIPYSEDESTEHKDLEELKESPISNIKENSENQHVLSLALIKQTNEQNRSRFLIQQNTFDDDCIRSDLKSDCNLRNRNKNLIRRSSVSVLHANNEPKTTENMKPLTECAIPPPMQTISDDNQIDNDNNCNSSSLPSQISHSTVQSSSSDKIIDNDNDDGKKAPLAEPEVESLTGAATLLDSNKTTNVCPWDDDISCNTDGTFVKTYATLGYL